MAHLQIVIPQLKKQICTHHQKLKLQAELARIKYLIPWHGFPKRIGDVIINNKLKGLNVNIKNTTNNDWETIWIKIPYLGDQGDNLLKSLKAKLKHHFTKAFYKSWGFTPTWKMRHPNWWNPMLFTSLIVQVVMIDTLEKLSVIYAQEQKNMLVVMKERSFTTTLKTAVITAILKIYSVSIMIHFIKHYLVSTVWSNTKIIESAFDWNILLIKEALLIKQKMPKLNNSLKASKELKLILSFHLL